MTADKVGVVFTNQISGTDRIWAEAQMRNRNCAGFFRVIDEITLSELFGRFADNFNGVFIGAYRAVTTQTVKHGLNRLVQCIGAITRIPIQAGMSNIIMDADGEMIFRLRLYSIRQKPP